MHFALLALVVMFHAVSHAIPQRACSKVLDPLQPLGVQLSHALHFCFTLYTMHLIVNIIIIKQSLQQPFRRMPLGCTVWLALPRTTATDLMPQSHTITTDNHHRPQIMLQ